MPAELGSWVFICESPTRFDLRVDLGRQGHVPKSSYPKSSLAAFGRTGDLDCEDGLNLPALGIIRDYIRCRLEIMLTAHAAKVR